MTPGPALLAVAFAFMFSMGCEGVESDPHRGASPPPPATSQGLSWTGRPLLPRDATPAELAAIARADSLLGEAPKDVARVIAAARVREVVWRYEEALELYRQAMIQDPGNYEPFLSSAHRLIRLRRVREALDRLDQAKILDPTGFNTAYLRGLALYLLGHFGAAAEEYLACLRQGAGNGADTLVPGPEGEAVQKGKKALGDEEASPSGPGDPPDFRGSSPGEGDPRQCHHVASDPASRVALTAWAVRALRRADRDQEASSLLEGLPETFPPDALAGPLPEYASSPIVPGDNRHYWALLRFFRGDLPEEALLDPGGWKGQWPTVAYGVAVWRLLEGQEEAARTLLDEIVADPNWARLGHVAAEADLLRLEGEPLEGASW